VGIKDFNFAWETLTAISR